MEKNADTSNEKKNMNKAKSFNIGPSMKLRNEPVKRKSFNVNEAVKTLDIALGRLKKSKLVNGEYSTSTMSTMSRSPTDMFRDISRSSNINQSMDNASLMSMNFSHYELVRNVSQSNCNSDGAFSGTTCNAHLSPADSTVRNEHLERYFRSAEMWTRTGDPNNDHLQK